MNASTDHQTSLDDMSDIAGFVRLHSAWMLPVAQRILQDKGHAEATGTGDEDADWYAFNRGAKVARTSKDADAAFLTQLFSVRKGMLAGETAPADMKSYLSGLLIGMAHSCFPWVT